MTGERSNESQEGQPVEDDVRHRAVTYLGLTSNWLGRREFGEALRFGMPPADPALHEPLRRKLVERHQMHEQPWRRWLRRLAPFLYGFLAIANVAQGLSGKGWSNFVAAAGFAAMYVLFVWLPGVEQRQIDRLEAALPPAPDQSGLTAHQSRPAQVEELE